jgi:hypothetical protein
MTIRTLTLAAIALAVVAESRPAQARPQRDFGLGIILGRPSGVTMEFGLAANQSIDLAIGIDAFRGERFYVHGNYLFYLSPVVQGQADLSPYLGAGIFVSSGSRGGIRVPFGFSLDFQAAPLKLFIEVAPHLRLFDEVDLDFGVAGGFRYFF